MTGCTDGREQEQKRLFSLANRFTEGLGKVIPLKASNTELHSMKSIKAFLQLSPGHVLTVDGAEN